MTDQSPAWIEVWLDPTTMYLLVVRPNGDSGFAVVDPRESGKIVFEHTEYEAVKSWLLEDEYEMVRGRVDLDE